MAKQKEETAVVVPVKRPGPLSPSRRAGEEGKRLTSSYNPNDPAQRMLALKATLHQDAKSEDIRDEILNLQHWLTIDAEATDVTTGELKQFVRTVLIEENGRRISCGSDWVIDALMKIEACLGPAPWDPPLRVRIVEGKGKSGHVFNTLDIV